MTLVLAFALCAVAMTQISPGHRWLLVIWVTVVMSASALLADWQPASASVMSLVYLGLAVVCLTHYLRRRASRLLTEDAGMPTADLRVADLPRSELQSVDEDRVEMALVSAGVVSAAAVTAEGAGA